MSDQLPEPLVPAEVDLRDTPIPLGLLVRMVCDQFGVSAQEAEAMVRSWAAMHGVRMDTGGDA